MRKYKNATHYVIASLIPFTDPNLKLTFKPNLFFKELSSLQNLKENTVRNAFHRSVKAGLITLDEQGVPQLTAKGKRQVEPYASKKLKNSHLMIVFDIPEEDRWKRQHLRLMLKQLSFIQVQKSVWISQYDHREYIKAEIKQLDLKDQVLLYESRKLSG